MGGLAVLHVKSDIVKARVEHTHINFRRTDIKKLFSAMESTTCGIEDVDRACIDMEKYI